MKVWVVEWVDHIYKEANQMMGIFSTAENAEKFVNEAVIRFNQHMHHTETHEEDTWYDVEEGYYVATAHTVDNMLKW